MLNLKFMWIILDKFTLISEWLILYVVFNIASNKKIKSNYIYLSITILATILGVLIQEIDFTAYSNNDFFTPILFLLIFISIVYYKSCYKVSFINSIFISTTYWIMAHLIDTFSMEFIAIVNSMTTSTLLSDNAYKLQIIALSKTILILILLMIRYITNSKELKTIDFLYVLIPSITNIFNLAVIYNNRIQNKYSNFSDYLIFIFASFLTLFSSIALVYVTFKTIKNNRLKLENEIIKEKMNIDYQFYLNVESKQEKIRSLYHDMSNHMTCICNLDNLDDIRTYVNKLQNNIIHSNNFFNTGNRILNIILTEKKELCIKHNIKFEAIVDFSNLDFIDIVDISVIFSNILDNAIEACEKINDDILQKYISLKVTYVNEICIIRVENSKVNKIIINNGIFSTNKKNNFLHGLGLKNVKSVIDKYNGHTKHYFNDNKFIVSIMIPTENKLQINT